MPGQIKTVLFSDGEEVDTGDLNNVQAYTRAFLSDYVLSARSRQNEYDGVVTAASLYCYALAGAAPRTSATTRTIGCDAGVIRHYSGGLTPNGTAEQFHSYAVNANEITAQLTVGDGTHPRIDLVCVKLSVVDNDVADEETRDFKDAVTDALSSQTFVKKTKIVLTQQVVIGAPGVTPAEPAVPAGFVKWAAVYVPTSWNAVIDPLNVTDYRMPVGFATAFVLPHQALPGATAIPIDAATGLGRSSGAAQTLYYTLADMPAYAMAQLLRLKFRFNSVHAGTVPTIQLVRRDLSVSWMFAETDTVLEDFTGVISHDGEITFTPATPVWGNGHRAGVTMLRDGASGAGRTGHLALKVTSAAADEVYGPLCWEAALLVG